MRSVCRWSRRVALSPAALAAGLALCAVALACVAAHAASDTPPVTIDLAGDNPRERVTKETLEWVLANYNLKRYTFTRKVVIELGVTNHAFPVLTLNASFARAPLQLLSTYVHEQLHWHLREQGPRLQSAMDELRRLYPKVPVGLPDAAETEASTYAHLLDCYLEIVADREILGVDQTAQLIARKPWYSWIYKTVLADEQQIAAVVDRYDLRVR